MRLTPLKIERVIARIRKMLEGYLNTSGQVYVHDRVAEYRSMWQHIAMAAGAEFTELSPDIWEIGLNGRKTRINNDIIEFDDPVILEIAGRKPLVYQMLKTAGLSIPDYLVFDWEDVDRAFEFLHQHPFGCVIKPANGTSSGQGVTTHLQTPREVRSAAVLASMYCKKLIIEPMVPGECYRLLVLDGKVIHAVCRRGYRLAGDGRSSITELLRQEDRRRVSQGLQELKIDRDCRFTLGYQHLSMDDVVPEGKEFLIKSVNDDRRENKEVRTVYNETVTGLVCDDLIRDAQRAARLLGSRFVGVDFITVDPSVPLKESGGVINELNTTPGLHHHYDASTEKFPKPGIEILNALLD